MYNFAEKKARAAIEYEALKSEVKSFKELAETIQAGNEQIGKDQRNLYHKNKSRIIFLEAKHDIDRDNERR